MLVDYILVLYVTEPLLLLLLVPLAIHNLFVCPLILANLVPVLWVISCFVPLALLLVSGIIMDIVKLVLPKLNV